MKASELIRIVKEQQRKIEQLEARLAILEARPMPLIQTVPVPAPYPWPQPDLWRPPYVITCGRQSTASATITN